MNRSLIACVLVMLLAACSEPAPQALGTLEYDRIALPAPAAERIVDIAVREGERVEAGARGGGRARLIKKIECRAIFFSHGMHYCTTVRMQMNFNKGLECY